MAVTPIDPIGSGPSSGAEDGKKKKNQSTPTANQTPTAPTNYPTAPYNGPTAPSTTSGGVSTTSYDSSKYGYGTPDYNNPGSAQAGHYNDWRLANEPGYRESEIERAKSVIANLQAEGRSTADQEAYLSKLLGMSPVSTPNTASSGKTTGTSTGPTGAFLDFAKTAFNTVMDWYNTARQNNQQAAQVQQNQQPQAIDLGEYTRQIVDAVGSLVNSSRNDAASQALIAKWMEQMSATLAQLETTILNRIRETGSMEDPSVRAALATLREQFDLQRKDLLEDLAARGVAQSGIMVDLEARLSKGLLSEQEKLLASRLSEMEQMLTSAIMNFANQRMQIMSWGAQASLGAQQAALDRAFQAQQTQISSLLNLANMGQQESQFQRQLDFTKGENALNRQFQWNMQQNQQMWSSGESERQRAWQSAEAERQRQWATSERLGTQAWDAQQKQIDREFQQFMQDREFAWQTNQAQMDRDLQVWIMQQQFKYGWDQMVANQNFERAKLYAQQAFQASESALDRSNALALAGMKQTGAGATSGTSRWVVNNLPTYVDALKHFSLDRVKAIVSEDVNEANAAGANISMDDMALIYSVLEYLAKNPQAMNQFSRQYTD